MRYALTDVIEGIVGRPIAERSENAMVRCPLHEDRRPSLSVNLESGVWVCFSCGERGKTGKLARVFEKHYDSSEVALRSVRGIGEEISEEESDFAELAKSLYQRAQKEKPQAIISYISSKGLSPAVFNHFQMGWDGSRIALPYWDGDKCVGIKYRNLFGQKS
jgi:DNA primase